MKYYESKKSVEIKSQMSFDLEPVKEESKVEKRLKEIDPLKVTPMDALNILYELKKSVEDSN